MMARKTLITSLGVFALAVIAIGEASAYSRVGSSGFSRPEVRSDRRELLNKRAEVRRDLSELHRKRPELRGHIRHTPPRPRYVPRHPNRDYYRDHRGIGWYRHRDGRWYRYPPRYGWWR